MPDVFAFETSGRRSDDGGEYESKGLVMGGKEVAKRASANMLDDRALAALLEPYKTREAIFRTLNPVRIGLVCALTVFVVACSIKASKETFTVVEKVREEEKGDKWFDSTYTLERCRERCAADPHTLGECEGQEGAEKYKLEVKENRFVRFGDPALAHEVETATGYCYLKRNVPRWKGLVTIAAFFFCVLLLIEGAPGEVVLVGGAAILAVLGILDKDVVYSGLASGGVMGLALLPPIANTISETGVFEDLMFVILGKPKSLRSALARFCFPVLFVSAFISDSALVALMLPVLLSWSRRIKIDPGKLLMPLSFAAQLGGSITKVGSSHVVVAGEVTKARYNDGEGMGMFDTSLIATLVGVMSICTIILTADSAMLSSSDVADRDGDGDDDLQDMELYRLELRITRGPFLGKSLLESGLEQSGGVSMIQVVKGSADRLSDGDVLECFCDVNGVIEMRRWPGIKLLCNDYLIALGARRRRRALFEVSIDAESEFLSSDILDHPNRLLSELGAVLVAGPKSRSANRHPQLFAGSVLLFEANEAWITDIASKRWNEACALIVKVPRSSPKRVGGPVDSLRSCAVCGGMVLMVLSQVFVDGLPLHIAASILVLFYIVIRAISVERVFSTIKAETLMIITGAIAFGEALLQTGVVALIAESVLAFAYGEIMIFFLVYMVIALIGSFINNSAVVAIFAPMLGSICDSDPSLSYRGLAIFLTLASGTCFTTPLGYQTNLMVMPAGRYSFGDFFKYGAINQLAHMLFCIVCVKLLAPSDAVAAVVSTSWGPASAVARAAAAASSIASQTTTTAATTATVASSGETML